MPVRIYAMDTYFYTPQGAYEFDVRSEMLAELGYDATYLTLWSQAAWSDLPNLARVRQKHGLDVAAVYVEIDPWKPAADPIHHRVTTLVRTLEGCRAIELAINCRASGGIEPSDSAGDARVLDYLHPLLEIARSRDIHLYLYPHIGLWIQRIEDAVRICRAMNHPNLGAVFCGFHWFAVDGQNVFDRLDHARPFLRQVNLCGSRRSPAGVAGKATIETLDEGEIDNFAILGRLREIGYDGYIGLQGYSVGGDVYAKLRRSLQAFRDMENRLDRHPRWAQLRRS